MNQPTHDELAGVVRDHAGRLAAALMPLVGSFAAAEDLVQDAVEAALTHWPHDGIPDRPDAWLYTVARRRGLDLIRRDRRHHTKLAMPDRLCRARWTRPRKSADVFGLCSGGRRLPAVELLA